MTKETITHIEALLESYAGTPAGKEKKNAEVNAKAWDELEKMKNGTKITIIEFQRSDEDTLVFYGVYRNTTPKEALEWFAKEHGSPSVITEDGYGVFTLNGGEAAAYDVEVNDI